MKLTAPPGVGDPCVAGVTIAPRNGVYDVEPDIGALLMESFGFVAAEDDAKALEQAKPAPVRRGKPAAHKA
jgi:hypothetical protein